ncbi:MAG: tRNA (uridine(34)/cytosine(34)/5-carboxymethylaminomethyluridine(34)-2'-O)-methyltransferase TrmL [Gammaproteobacteria bacterium]|nr:tRNA (uridine(34)/cytosine(34)/5-carboxymethylaminomethyluridine(34)-2'-O)-methyltransferase TrmL [Gammaproteobacteria bacterium]|tara:strand:- start:3377 stop:3844 length:468 start_codon:yes stop_codon:yes gene_type:complete
MPVDVVLYQPEIPPNTGNVIRICANTGANLHLVEPLGFELDNKRLRRAGLDYHEFADIHVHASYKALLNSLGSRRIYAFTTKASRSFSSTTFAKDDVLLFGPETRGLPANILAEFSRQNLLRIPMRKGSRSLNLSNAVAVAVFEAWRQLGYRQGG